MSQDVQKYEEIKAEIDAFEKEAKENAKGFIKIFVFSFVLSVAVSEFVLKGLEGVLPV